MSDYGVWGDGVMASYVSAGGDGPTDGDGGHWGGG